MNNREIAIENLRASAHGTMETHVWTSPRYDNVPMKYVYTSVGTVMDPSAHGLPEPFATEVGIEYAGVLTREQAKERARELSYGPDENGDTPLLPTREVSQEIAHRALQGLLGRMMHP